VAIESEQGKRYPAFFYILINASRAIGCLVLFQMNTLMTLAKVFI